MVDVWLIFAQVVPWIEVLLHTLIDWMREEEDEDEGRKINHHGKSITVGGRQDTEKVKLIGQPILTTNLHQFAEAPGGRPFTGRTSREAYADMTQVNDT